MTSRPSHPTPIILLKTRSQPDDAYQDFFSASPSPSSIQFTPTFIPVLKHVTNLEPAISWIRSAAASTPTQPSPDPPSSTSTYGGLIFTSQRAVEAFSAAWDAVSSPSPSPSPSSSHPPITSLPSLRLPIYVVGPATGKAVRAVCASRLPNCRVLGAEAGNGAELAQIILKGYLREDDTTAAATSPPRPPLLFFVGEQRRDIIPRTLMDPDLPESERVRVDETVVYQTGVEEGFEGAFREVLEGLLGARGGDGDGGGEEEETRRGGGPIWVVVFSPTGCRVMLDVLGWDGGARAWKTRSWGEGGRVRVATIGPTTRDHLREKLGFEPDVWARRPSPEGVREVIEQFAEDG